MNRSSIATSSDPGELDKLESEIDAESPAPEQPAAAAAGPAAEPSSGGPELGGPEPSVAQTLDQLGENPDMLGKLTREDVGEMIALPFSLVAVQRGPHWQCPAESEEGKLIAKWVTRAIERHGWNAVASWMPDILAVALLANAVARRVQLDKKERKTDVGPVVR